MQYLQNVIKKDNLSLIAIETNPELEMPKNHKPSKSTNNIVYNFTFNQIKNQIKTTKKNY